MSMWSFITRYRWPLLTAVALGLALVSSGALLAQPGGPLQRPAGLVAQAPVQGTGTVSTSCGRVGFTSATDQLRPNTENPTVALTTTLALPCTGPVVANVVAETSTTAINAFVAGVVLATCTAGGGRGSGCTPGAVVTSQPSVEFSPFGVPILGGGTSISSHSYQGLFPSLLAGTWRFDFVIFAVGMDSGLNERSLVVQTYAP